MGNVMSLVFVAVVMVSVLGGITLLTHVYSLNGIKNKRLVTDSMALLVGQQRKKFVTPMYMYHSIQKNGVKETVCPQNKAWWLVVKEQSSILLPL